MIISQLHIANLRAISSARLTFRSGFNLIMGVNGAGKTTVLDALALCLARVTRHVNKLKGPLPVLGTEDIREGSQGISIDCTFELGAREYTYGVYIPREPFITGPTPEKVRRNLPSYRFLGESPPKSAEFGVQRPLAVLFSTRRAVPSDRSATKSSARGGIGAALAEAFLPRELRLGELAEWLQAVQAQMNELPRYKNLFLALEKAVERFLPGYQDLRVKPGKPPRLLLGHGQDTLPLHKLSDGERGVLAIVLDLTRRLAQANEDLTDPAAEGQAVVLIDELDLHLHPLWQRQIISRLTATFPKVQFIATTHSPQILGEVEHERIQILSEGEVYQPQYSFGVDSNRVLEEIMGAPARTLVIEELLSRISVAVAENRYEDARGLVDQLALTLGENDAEVVRSRTLLDLLTEDEE